MTCKRNKIEEKMSWFKSVLSSNSSSTFKYQRNFEMSLLGVTFPNLKYKAAKKDGF